MNMIEHLLYKALFELSTDRADFLSRLFSRKRPGGLARKASIEAIFDAYETAAPDRAIFERNLADVLAHLFQTRQFRLSKEDEEQIRYVYSAFFRSGPNLSYTFNDSYYQGTLGMPTYRQLMLDTDGQNPPHNLGFLATEEQFLRVQAMQRKNLIIPLVGDFAGPKYGEALVNTSESTTLYSPLSTPPTSRCIVSSKTTTGNAFTKTCATYPQMRRAPLFDSPSVAKGFSIRTREFWCSVRKCGRLSGSCLTRCGRERLTITPV